MTIKTFTPTQQPVTLPGARVLGLRSKDEFQVAKSIYEGFSTVTIGRLADALGVPDSYVLNYTNIPESTYHSRKRNAKPLSPEESRRVYRIAKVTAAAEDFFEGDKLAARRWLTNPKTALGGKTPLEFARIPEGSDYVTNLLGRLEHGVIS